MPNMVVLRRTVWAYVGIRQKLGALGVAGVAGPQKHVQRKMGHLPSSFSRSPETTEK